ncbi:MAG TPA: BON domain-containing protein [Terriglobales bacterium]|jgi:osmotically-inducible protein OsmY|nr:BON domain-containing protein [Terriglobales bacterium]
MKHFLCGFLLMMGALAFAQQQPPSQPPRGEIPRQQMPPDTRAPARRPSADVAQQIQDKFNTEPALAKQNVKANATDSAVILTGTVENEQQHQMAIRIAQSYSGGREVLDRIEVKGKA